MHRLFGSEISNWTYHFRDYILQKYKVELTIKEEQTKYGIMLVAYVDPDCPVFTLIEQESKEFLRNPFDSRYEQSSWQTGQVEKTEKLKWENWLPTLSFFEVVKKQKFTVFITAFCIVIYFFQLIGFELPILLFAHYPEDAAQQGELWRYFSHSLVHLSPWHITFNLVWWWIFAGQIEQKCGTTELVILYLVSAFLSGFAQNIASGAAFFGLSGVVYAVLGYVLVLDKFSRQQKFYLPQGFFTMLLMGIAFGFVSPFIGISMGNTAHITGLLTGIALAFLKIRFGKA